MKLSSKGWFKLPLRHISIRVPWHDSGWTGRVCNNPKANTACLVLNRIRSDRDDDNEATVAGMPLSDLLPEQWPVCIYERGMFMAPFEFTYRAKHPYSETSELHKHILPTPFRLPKYSAAALPFRWMLKENAWEIAEEFNLECYQDWEPKLAFNTWVQDYRNQKALLDAFFSSVHPEKSLCFFYAKQTPLAEDNRRVIVGVGHVHHLGQPIEYNYKEDRLRCLIWERAIQHSIRPDFKDGFILPYYAILASAEKDQSIDPAEYLAYAPEDRRIEFSYATEHVTNDGAIGALLSCAAALKNMTKVVDGSFERQLKWIDRRLSELWKLRGPFPGLGAALCAFGIEHGNFLAYELSSQLGDNEDPWPLVDKVFKDPTSLPKELSQQIGKTLQAKWKNLSNERRALIKLISRFEISVEQATRFYVEEERAKLKINCTDREILSNPYILYELDRFSPDPISVNTIDRGMFPDTIVRKKHPIPGPSSLDGASDWRRVRALIVNTLEQAAEDGDTLLPQSQVIQTIRELPLKPDCPIDRDLLNVVEDKFGPVITLTKMKDDTQAYQLLRLTRMGEIIRTTVEKLLIGKRHVVVANWQRLLDEELDKTGIKTTPDEDENRARGEKVAALKELTESRFSVLIGPAGTGKTTLLSILCHHPEINRGGILLLAPTGKARVQMQQKTSLRAQTIAQFLLPHDRYDELTGIYRLSDRDKVEIAKTVIVDEASMLTEEQLGALLDSIKGVHRLILVGDTRQLPPIGAGRPFVDIVNRLIPPTIETMFPRIGPGYAEMTIRLRQAGQVREDLQLADWFSGRDLGPGEDEIFDYILKEKTLDRIRFVQWDNQDEIREKILDVLVEELKLASKSDSTGFELKLGGKQVDGYVYFNRGAAAAAETWQILSPVRGHAHGVRDINRLVQKTFRARTVMFANDHRSKRIPKPLGPDGIVYGDKVINTENNRRYKVYPEQDALKYVANGEIGIVVGMFRKKSKKWKGALPLNVEFSSQLGFTYDYSGHDFKEEANPRLELAYAITVHKAQGSEFDLCLLILPTPCRLLSRELLYTALTRQRDRIIILHQSGRSELKKYSSAYYSETARRLTNLFLAPEQVKIDDLLFENQLIHRTRRGEAVQSKSEVIIADNLSFKGIEYVYEQKLIGCDGTERYPDFTIEDAESGVTYYWEHLGMLHEKGYQERWERKLEWYRTQGILSYEEGIGEKGSLIITQDTDKGGIKSDEIKGLIEKIWRRS